MNTRRYWSKWVRPGVYAGAAALTSVSPQVLGAEGSVLETVMVTAQKREQDVQDVGIALTAFSGDQLESLGFENSIDIARMTPGVHLGGSIAGQTSMFTIRGVTQNDFTDSVEAPVAVYVDEGYIALGQGQVFGLFDIDRVEIAKGPQSTLFGRNATGGVVHYITRKPEREFGGYADVKYGSYNQIGVEAALTGPVAEMASFRIAGMYNAHDEILDNRYREGWGGVENIAAGSAGGGQDMWNDDTWGVRGQLMIEPSDTFEALITGFASESNWSSAPYQQSPTMAIIDPATGGHLNSVQVGPNMQFEAMSPTGACVPIIGVDGELPGAGEDCLRDLNGTPTGGTDLFGYRDLDGADFDTSGDFAYDDLNSSKTVGGNVRLTWDLSDTTNVASITDFKQFDKYVIMDVDAGPTPQSVFQSMADVASLTEELRVTTTLDTTRWIGGYYFLWIDNETVNGLGVPRTSSLLGFEGSDANNLIDLETTSHALFGQMEFDFAEDWMLTVGGRVISERKDYSLSSPVYVNTADTVIDTSIQIPTPGGPLFLPISTEMDTTYEDKNTDTLWAGKVQVDWKPTDDVLMYAGVNRGVKAGSYNAQLQDGSPRLARDAIRYDEEVLTNYEGGFKTEWMDGRLRLNGSLYFYDYEDYQAFKFQQSSGTVSNNDGETIGAEFDITMNPVDGLDLMLAVSSFDAEVQQLEIAPGVFADVKPSYAPELQIAALARYAFAALGGELALQLDGNYSDEFYYNIRNFDSHLYDSYAVGNARASWTSSGGAWSVSAFVENFTDKRYGVMGYDLSTLCGCSEDYYGKPRWYGASVRYEF